MDLRRCFAMVWLAAVLVPLPTAAQVAPRSCGVLDGPSCTPNICGVLDGPGCIAEAQPGAGQNMQLTLGTQVAAPTKKPDGELNTLRELFAALRACWKPPAPENAYPGMQMSMRFSFNREGRLIGPPRVTYATPAVSQTTRDLYRHAIAQSLQDCLPLSFTKGLAGAIAGRPIAVRLIDNRRRARSQAADVTA